MAQKILTHSVGILGGGQLAQMLLEAAGLLRGPLQGPSQVRACALADSKDSPASKVGSTEVGTLEDCASLKKFIDRSDWITFENEFVNEALLREAAAGRDVFRPRLEAIAFLQDKLSQKQALSKLQIPYAATEAFSGDESHLEAWLKRVLNRFPQGLVLKWAKFGYDGYGCSVLSSAHQIPDAVMFCKKAFQRGSRIFAEEKMEFVRELAILAVRSTQGEFVAYPLVISEQKNGACHKITGPAVQLGVNPELEKKARQHALVIAEGLMMEGAFALEFFELKDGRLLVNEIAPRVHNSAHYTQDACKASQFENHLRAILGMKLGSVEATPFFAMLNLLSPGESEMTDPPSVPTGLHLHWYQKSQLKKGRKMGHINWVGADRVELQSALDQLNAVEQDWFKKVQSVQNS